MISAGSWFRDWNFFFADALKASDGARCAVFVMPSTDIIDAVC
jgi:hypothetical protein